MSTADRPDQADLREHAEFNARDSASGLGASVVRAEYRDGHHVWHMGDLVVCCTGAAHRGIASAAVNGPSISYGSTAGL